MTPLLKHALDCAAVWHRDQRRKYPGADVPYMSHLAGVAVILSAHGFDDEVVAAGALHDCIEDAGVTHDQLARTFGPRVAGLVRDVSEPDKSLSWEVRKEAALAAFEASSWEAQAISLADKIDNVWSIAVCAARHGDPWSMFKRGRAQKESQLRRLLDAARRLPPHPLVDEYARAVDALADA